MHGNVQELCRDGWDGTSGYAADAVVDPFVPSGLFRVLRGGGWSLGSDFCRSAHRGTIVPPFWANNAGFRVVCAPVRGASGRES